MIYIRGVLGSPNTYLVLRSSLFTKGLDSRHTDSKVVAANVVDLSLLNKRPDVRLLEMLNLVFVGRSKVSAHAAVVASDDHTALASGLSIIHTVLSVHTGLGAGFLEDIGILVTADTTNVDNGVVGEDVLTNRITVNI
jgi:hypothetical protein